MRLVFVGDGPTDVGPLHDTPHFETSSAAGRVLVRKIIERRVGRKCHFDAKPRPHRWVSRGGYARKVEVAVAEADADGFDGVVILADRDGPGGHDRLDALKAGRRAAQARTALPCAVGVAIETIEAWLLVPSAVKAGLGLERTPPEPPAPETLAGRKGTPTHPKSVLGTWRADVPEGRFDTVTAVYAAIAEEIDPAALESRCPAGFAPFAAEVRAEIAPLFER
ncbi:MAG TPA: hypothetical protein VGQ83_07890 [Polyangia bacterium]|jgi:hypothetical protein